MSFAREGCRRIALLDKDEEGLSETSRIMKAANESASSFIIPCDVRSEQEIRLSVECVIDEWGRLDYAVNCAGELPSILDFCFFFQECVNEEEAVKRRLKTELFTLESVWKKRLLT